LLPHLLLWDVLASFAAVECLHLEAYTGHAVGLLEIAEKVSTQFLETATVLEAKIWFRL
jgi:hypothetical protein